MAGILFEGIKSIKANNSSNQFRSEYAYKMKLCKEKNDLAKKFESEKLKDGSGELKPTMKTKIYVNRSKYKGEFLNDKRHGIGIYYYSNGDIYGGNWKSDVFEGFGLYIYSSGERYEGEFKLGKKHGKGKYFYMNGTVYEGSWALGRKNGHGVFQCLLTGGKLSFRLSSIFDRFVRKIRWKLDQWREKRHREIYLSRRKLL